MKTDAWICPSCKQETPMNCMICPYCPRNVRISQGIGAALAWIVNMLVVAGATYTVWLVAVRWWVH